jgi:carbonic anhydrase/acetyltransferase-like protein (isoleucine patch superfamily)
MLLGSKAVNIRPCEKGKAQSMALILPFDGVTPQIADGVFIAPNATVIGRVELAAGVNVWYGAVLRGDIGRIVVGPRTSVQDNVVIHVNTRHDTVVEGDVIIGHGVVLEGCHIGAGTLLGMNATILSGATVGAGAIIAAGAVVREGDEIPPGMLAAGVPARVKGAVNAAHRRRMAEGVAKYQTAAALHAQLGADS